MYWNFLLIITVTAVIGATYMSVVLVLMRSNVTYFMHSFILLSKTFPLVKTTWKHFTSLWVWVIIVTEYITEYYFCLLTFCTPFQHLWAASDTWKGGWRNQHSFQVHRQHCSWHYPALCICSIPSPQWVWVDQDQLQYLPAHNTTSPTRAHWFASLWRGEWCATGGKGRHWRGYGSE